MSRIALLILFASAAFADTLILHPPQTPLYGAAARQRLAVTVVSTDGVERDVTSEAQFTVGNANIAVVGDGAILQARANGGTRVQAKYRGLTSEVQAIIEEAAGKFEISFVKDVVPVFTRAGCAGSNCHGSIRGKAGFKLSLFGYEPDIDYNAILNADGGRRVDLKNPGQSLILKKPTFQIPHGGGVRFNMDSLEYSAIRDWIAGGAKYDSVGSPRIVSLEVYPRERRLVGIGTQQRLVVTARYTDGASEDVTGKVQFTSNNEAVASVSP